MKNTQYTYHSQHTTTLTLLLASLLSISNSAFANQYIKYSSDNTYPTPSTLNLTTMLLNQEITVATDNNNDIMTTDDTPSNINSGRKFHCNDSSPAMSGGLIPSGNPDYKFRFYYGSNQITCTTGASPFFYSSQSRNHTDSIVPMYLKLVKVGNSGSTASITYPNFQLCSRDPSQSNNDPGCWRGAYDGLSRYYPSNTFSSIIINSPPIITSNGGGNSAAISVIENQTAVTTVTATDADNDPRTYSITGGTDASKFTINASTGVLSFVTAPNFETPNDTGANNVYDVQVTVSDGKGGMDTQTISVTVTDADEIAPVIAINVIAVDNRINAAEASADVTISGITDAEDGQTVSVSMNGKTYSGIVIGGIWSIIVPVTDVAALPESVLTITAKVSDVAGNPAIPAVHDITVDKTLPAISGTDIPQTNDLTPELSGITDVADGTTITVTDTNDTTVCTSIASLGTWACTPNTDLLSGSNTLTVTTSDPAGNSNSDEFTVVINTPPSITSNGGLPLAVSISENGIAITNVDATDAQDGAETNLTYSLNGADATKFNIDTNGNLSFKEAPDFEVPTDVAGEVAGDNVYEVLIIVTDSAGSTDTQAISVTVTDVDEDLALHIRGILQGAYNATEGLMRDDLRVLGLIPTAQPYGDALTSLGYAGTETLAPSVLSTSDHDAPVDWVVVELRNKTTPKTVVARVAALLQRDGDVANPQTNEAKLMIPHVTADQYFVTLRHRNHLGVMTQNAVALSSTLTTIDFSLPTQTVSGTNARLTNGSLALLWAGDTNNSDSIIAVGPNNDSNMVLGTILTHPTNLLANSNFLLNGYYVTDMNLDGVSIYTGPNNDSNLLLSNVLLHPANNLTASNYVIKGTMPK